MRQHATVWGTEWNSTSHWPSNQSLFTRTSSSSLCYFQIVLLLLLLVSEPERWSDRERVTAAVNSKHQLYWVWNIFVEKIHHFKLVVDVWGECFYELVKQCQIRQCDGKPYRKNSQTQTVFCMWNWKKKCDPMCCIISCVYMVLLECFFKLCKCTLTCKLYEIWLRVCRLQTFFPGSLGFSGKREVEDDLTVSHFLCEVLALWSG